MSRRRGIVNALFLVARREGQWQRGLIIRQRDAQRGTCPDTAFSPDVSTMLLDDPATDGQAQPGAAFLVRVAVAHLDEAIEDRFEFVRANAAALIANAKHQLAVSLGRVDPDRPAARRRELDGIR